MAQNFRVYKLSAVGTGATDIPDGSDFDSYDTLVGINIANIVSSTVNVDVYIADGGTNYYLIKSAPIPVGSQLQLIDGGAKVVVQNGDVIKVVSDTASSCDVWVSAVDSIST